jgi:phosphohistidine phosphatase SixA
MNTLYLVRHAKSSWATAAQADRDRPLNERGLHDAALISQRLAERGVKPDVMLTSPATRAHTTARHIAKALGVKGKHIVEVERLYDATADQNSRRGAGAGPRAQGGGGLVGGGPAGWLVTRVCAVNCGDDRSGAESSGVWQNLDSC